MATETKVARQPLHEHELGAPWSDDELESLLKTLSERSELDAIDAIVWLRFELAQERSQHLKRLLRASKSRKPN